MMSILSDESKLNEMVQLVGMDALSAPDRLKMEAARSIREDFLHQDAFHEIDTFSSLKKQFMMMDLVLSYYDKSVEALDQGASLNSLIALPVREEIGRFKYTPEKDLKEKFDAVSKELDKEIGEAESAKEDF